ncbi:MAG TPA: caspase family protein [Stellaceae bacterium]|jgi:hypothetical protein|nr:caspase family protein [Stellaceae bacterium]
MFRLLTAVVACMALMASLGATPANAEKRVALVIGNDTYEVLRPQLANAAADARDIGRALRDSGFETTVKTNVKRRELYQLIDAFGAAIAASPDTVGLFYYAGHGIQANGKNYLVPVDSELVNEGDLEAEAVDAGKVLRAMDEARNSVNIVILDACRDNPLPKARSLTRGLATMQAPRGTFIGYAAAPGQTAQDGEQGGNGVFTGALVEHLREQGVPIEEVFKHVIAGVQTKTGGKQVPWMESSLQGNFYFTAPVNVTVSPSPQSGRADDREVVFWESIKGSTDPADFADFLKRYPDSEFASIAQRRMASLHPAAVTAAPATPPPAAPIPQADAVEIARSVQSELKRVGCYSGTIDGVWGPGTQAAIQQFNQRTGKHIDTATASLESITAIKERADRVCPPAPVARPQPRESRDDANSAYQPPASSASRGASPYSNPGPSPYGSAPPARRDCFTFNGQQVCN